jgi:hypothetical protein
MPNNASWILVISIALHLEHKSYCFWQMKDSFGDAESTKQNDMHNPEMQQRNQNHRYAINTVLDDN